MTFKNDIITTMTTGFLVVKSFLQENDYKYS